MQLPQKSVFYRNAVTAQGDSVNQNINSALSEVQWTIFKNPTKVAEASAQLEGMGTAEGRGGFPGKLALCLNHGFDMDGPWSPLGCIYSKLQDK